MAAAAEGRKQQEPLGVRKRKGPPSHGETMAADEEEQRQEEGRKRRRKPKTHFVYGNYKSYYSYRVTLFAALTSGFFLNGWVQIVA
ncbi:hypothetical protein BHE74_00032398 [Ensete ventricosum]|nr:hypothetical protein BHE74_00032398 [Ensete ventricosum]RZS10010.1 hypothetical protein BHM03_00041152 [Ensete ventricosum]